MGSQQVPRLASRTLPRARVTDSCRGFGPGRTTEHTRALCLHKFCCRFSLSVRLESCRGFWPGRTTENTRALCLRITQCTTFVLGAHCALCLVVGSGQVARLTPSSRGFWPGRTTDRMRALYLHMNRARNGLPGRPRLESSYGFWLGRMTDHIRGARWHTTRSRERLLGACALRPVMVRTMSHD